jgi:hypothetical protein
MKGKPPIPLTVVIVFLILTLYTSGDIYARAHKLDISYVLLLAITTAVIALQIIRKYFTVARVLVPKEKIKLPVTFVIVLGTLVGYTAFDFFNLLSKLFGLNPIYVLLGPILSMVFMWLILERYFVITRRLNTA